MFTLNSVLNYVKRKSWPAFFPLNVTMLNSLFSVLYFKFSFSQAFAQSAVLTVISLLLSFLLFFAIEIKHTFFLTMCENAENRRKNAVAWARMPVSAAPGPAGALVRAVFEDFWVRVLS